MTTDKFTHLNGTAGHSSCKCYNIVIKINDCHKMIGSYSKSQGRKKNTKTTSLLSPLRSRFSETRPRAQDSLRCQALNFLMLEWPQQFSLRKHSKWSWGKEIIIWYISSLHNTPHISFISRAKITLKRNRETQLTTLYIRKKNVKMRSSHLQVVRQ